MKIVSLVIRGVPFDSMGGSGFDPRVFWFFFSWGWSTFFLLKVEYFFLKRITCTFCMMPYTITSTVSLFFGAIIVGLSRGGGGRKRGYNFKFEILWCEYLWVATSPGGGFGGPPPKKIYKYEVLKE